MDRLQRETLESWGLDPSTGLSSGPTVSLPAPASPTADANRLAALSALLLDWHAGARQWPAGHWLPRALDRLATTLPFHGVRWALLPACALAPGAAAPTLLFEQGQWPGDGPALRAIQPDALSGNALQLCLYRSAALPDFSAADEQLLRCLMPHLAHLWRESHLDTIAARSAWRRQAVCDASGRLQQADDAFVALLRQEWPHWRNGLLPLALRRQACALAAQPAAQPIGFYGRVITAMLRPAPGVVLLDLRRRNAVDRLSPHQRALAHRYASGQTGPQIAQALGLSPSTINNHLGLIFKRLAVHNKLQLLALLRESTGVSASEGGLD